MAENSDSENQNRNSVESFKKNNQLWYKQQLNLDVFNPCSRPFSEIGNLMFDLHGHLDNVEILPGKVKKHIIEHGSGDLIPNDAHVYLHYSCYLDGVRTAYDCSLLRSFYPEHHQMGRSCLFYGFELALSSMRLNEGAQFLIHPDYAYGKLGHPPRIPGNAHVMLVVNIFGVIDCGFAVLSNRENMVFNSFQEKLKYAQSLSALADDHFKHKRIKLAARYYRNAQRTLTDPAGTELDEKQRLNILQEVYINRLMCFSHPKFLNPRLLLDIAKEDISALVQNNGNYHYCLGVAYTHLHEFKAAMKSFKIALKLSPNLPKLNSTIRYMFEMADKADQEERMRWREAFDKLGYAAVPEKDENEKSEEIQQMEQMSAFLKKFLQQDNVSSIRLGFKLTKFQRSMFDKDLKKLYPELKFVATEKNGITINVEVLKKGK